MNDFFEIVLNQRACRDFSDEPVPDEHIEQILTSLAAPIPRRALRRACRMRDSALGAALEQLVTAGRVVRSPAGYQLAQP